MPHIKVQDDAFVMATVWLQTWRSQLQDYAILVDKLEGTICWGMSITLERLRSTMDFAEDYATVYQSLKHTPRPMYWGSEEIYRTGGWLDGWLDWASQNESPLAFLFWAGVALLGAAAKRKFFVPRGRATNFPNHYIVLVGHSAIQKSGCIDAAKMLLTQANRLVKKDVPIERQIVILPEVISAAQMALDLSQVKIPDKNKTEKGKGYVIKPRAETPAIWFVSEFASGLGKDTAQSNDKIRMLNELFSRDNYDASSIASGLKMIRNASMSVLGASTLQWLKSDMDPKVITGGFASRVHWIYRDWEDREDFLDPDPYDPVLGLQLCELLTDLLRTDTPTAVPPTPEARDWLDEWYRGEHKPLKRANDDPDLHGILGRKDDYIYKLALILAISKGSPVITLDVMQKAKEIIDYEQPFTLQCFEALYDTEESVNQDKIVAKLRSTGGWVAKEKFWDWVGRKLCKLQDRERTWDYLLNAGRVRQQSAKARNGQSVEYVRAAGKWEEDPDEHLPLEHPGVMPTGARRRKRDSKPGSNGSST